MVGKEGGIRCDGIRSLTRRMHWIREALDKIVYIILGNRYEANKSETIRVFFFLMNSACTEFTNHCLSKREYVARCFTSLVPCISRNKG
jgi:hypothetical protein